MHPQTQIDPVPAINNGSILNMNFSKYCPCHNSKELKCKDFSKDTGTRKVLQMKHLEKINVDGSSSKQF